MRHALANGNQAVITVACDMPYVTALVLRQLCEHPSGAPILAARREREGLWEPMLARYDATRVVDVVDDTISSGHRSFQRLFEAVETDAWPVSPAIERALRDWDTPQDIPR
jgi:molybdopterin-guanine dinucleotide biosynthesis protein A